MYSVTQDFLDKMVADKRQVFAKVQVDYTDPFIDQSINTSSSENAIVSYPSQTADAVETMTYKWASLDGSSILDGSYRVAPTADKLSQYQFGWWGLQLSGTDGSFVSPYPTLTVTHIARPVHQLKVVGDSARGEYPVDFSVRLYNSVNTLLYEEVVTGNTAITWSKVLTSSVNQVTKQVLEVRKWSHSGRQVKIVEFFTSIQETYLSGDIVSIRLLEEREVSQGSLPVGNISANELTLVLANDGHKFDVDNTQSPLYGVLKPNRRVKAWLGAEAENNYSENPPTFTRSSVAYKSDGTQVAANVPRFEPGKFAQAVMVEEGTTVTPTNPFFASGVADWSLWVDTANGASATKEQVAGGDFGGYIARVSVINDGLSFSSVQFYKAIGSVTNGQKIACRIRIKASQAVNNVPIMIFNNVSPYTNYGTFYMNLTSDWQVFTFVATATEDATARVDVYLGAKGDGVVYDIDYICCEIGKAYSTSPHDGTRSPETLTIPTAGVLNPQEGTVEGWFYITDYFPTSTDTRRLFRCYTGTDGNPGGVNLWGNGSSLAATMNGSSAGIPRTNLTTGWHYIGMRWTSERLSLLVDGQEVNHVISPQLSPYFTDTASVGTSINHIGQNFNSLIDDLRISSRARTDAEIAAAYASGQPLPVDADTTYKLTFNGSIYPVEKVWVPLGTFWTLDWDSLDDTLEATVTARDRMELLRKGTYQSSQVQTNVSLYTLAEQVLQNAGLTSTEYAIDTALQSITVPYAWFNPVTHREALRIIAEAALAVVYCDRNGIIRIDSLGSGLGATSVLTITDNDYFLPFRAPSRQDQVANEVIVTTQPLKPTTVAEEVYRSNNPIVVPAGQTVSVTVYYNQPPVIEAVASLDSPPAGVSIVTATYYGWGAQVSIGNIGTSSASVTLVISGKPLTIQNKERAVARDEVSIVENGVLRYEFSENPLVQTLTQAQQIADTLLASVKDSRRDVELDWRGNPALVLGDRVTIKGSDYHVIRQEISWVGALSALLVGRKVAA